MAAGAGLRRQAAAATEAKLKDAALVAFEELGYLNTKITDITARAGRATGSFYSHFASKEALLEALLADLLAANDEAVRVDDHGDDFADPAVVRWHIAAFLTFHRQNRTVMTALQQAAIVDERFARRSRELLAPDLEHIADHLRKGETSGLRLPGDPLFTAGMLSHWLQGIALNLDGDPDPQTLDTLTAMFHGAIGGR